jgi:THO complex subunit 1
VNDGQWGWRALRLLAKKSPNFFTYGNNPIAKLPDYLVSILQKSVSAENLTDKFSPSNYEQISTQKQQT